MKIKDIEVIWLDVPMHEIAGRAMERSQNGWSISEIIRVTTESGLVGIGENLPGYYGATKAESIARARGQNPFDLLWDDTLGAGLQMALFDVAGKAAEAPVYRLLGNKIRDWCPISWWAMDMPPEDFAEETKRAAALGYTTFKQKARPWWDVYEQARLTSAVASEGFSIGYDFNGLLIHEANAIPVLAELDHYSIIGLYESPIPHGDFEGYHRIRSKTNRPIAVHYGNFGFMSRSAITPVDWKKYYDGFVLDQIGAAGILRHGHWAEEANMPFWMQTCGTGISTAMGLHLGSVLKHAQWPLVSCVNIYQNQLITQPIVVQGGYARVPEAPGLGIEFNEETLKWQVDSPEKPNVDALYAVVRHDGNRTWYTDEMGPAGYWNDFANGSQPICEHGVRLERWDNDGSPEWRDMAQRVQTAPVRTRE